MKDDADDLARERRIRAELAALKELFAKSPGLEARTLGALEGEIPCPALEETMPSDRQITFRLPSELLDRADAMVEVLAAEPEFQAYRMSRGVVLRLALHRGLESLEAEFARRRRR